MLTILTILGILIAPIFTFGFVLIHYNHPWLGVLAIIVSLLKCTNDNSSSFTME